MPTERCWPARRRRLAAAILAGAMAAGSAARAQAIKLPQDAKPLPLVTVARSIPELIADGYEVVSLNEGLGGSAILLRKAASVILCTLGSYGTPAEPKVFTRCQRLSNG